MIINSITDINGKYKVVYFDDGFLFKAKNWEIKKLKLEIDMDVTPEQYEKLFQEFGIKRCRFKAVDILSRTDKSEQELRRKLKDAYFASNAIDEVILQLKDKKYVDDERVAYNYILANKTSKSRVQLIQKLQEKEIDKDIINNILEDEYDCQIENEIVKKNIPKYLDSEDNITYKNYNKLVAAMYRKGISQRVTSKIVEENYNIIRDYE